jgi:hypothetical protein
MKTALWQASLMASHTRGNSQNNCFEKSIESSILIEKQFSKTVEEE